MTTNVEAFCTSGGDRGERLVAYLYDDLDVKERAEMEAHLAGCVACRGELAALGGVRTELAKWSPPEPAFGSLVRPASLPRRRLVAALGEIPVWAQAAAAILCVGVAAGFANLDMRYSGDGLTVRTGWSQAGQAGRAGQAGQAGQVGQVGTASARPWEADLAALEASLRADLASTAMAAVDAGQQPTAVDDPGDSSLASVRTLIEESEERQRRELALRLADMLRDVQYQRRDDLEKIDRSLGLIQANLGVMQSTGVEVMRQRQMINDLAVRVSQR